MDKSKFFLLLVVMTGLSIYQAYSQNSGTVIRKSELRKFNKDSLFIIERAQQANTSEAPDTNFTYEKYSNLLRQFSDTARYIVLPINEFRKRIATSKIVIGLRHDVDLDLGKAILLSEVEKAAGFRSTYYILHTANYYLADPENKAIHNGNILPVLKYMQDESGFEIGFHNDLVTLQLIYKIDPVLFLKQELSWLRENGLKIYGSASHGSYYCKVNDYLNYYFFYECSEPVVTVYINNKIIPTESGNMIIRKGNFSDFDLEYEAYFLNNNKYFSDSSFEKKKRWNIGMLDINTLKPGDRVIFLLHPVYWHKASRLTDIGYFYIPGQKSSSVNPVDSSITVILPYGMSRKGLIPTFSLAPGAYAKSFSSMQTSGNSINDFDRPVVYSVYAENRAVIKNWTVNVQNAERSECNIDEFTVEGLTKRVSIDKEMRTIKVKIDSKADLKNLTVGFRLSPGAKAFIGDTEQKSNTGKTDFSAPVIYKIAGEDGITTILWTVTIRK